MVSYFFLSLALVCFFMSFMLYRNNWVYKERTKAFDKGDGSYDKLPSYEEMLRKFWIWDLREFIQEKDNG